MELIKRVQDMVLGKDDLELLYVFRQFPVYMGTTSQSIEQDIYADMKWGISESSGMIQLLELVPEEILYKESHNTSLGKVWQEHHIQFAEFIHEHTISNERVVEIGGGNGILNAIYTSNFGEMPWSIIEPSNIQPVDGCKAHYIRDFWKEGLELGGGARMIVHSHLIEHQYSLNGFMRVCAETLEEGQRMIFSVPNMKEWLKRKFLNVLNFEHSYFITDFYIEEMLYKWGFKIIKKKLYREEHSIFYATEKCKEIVNTSKRDYKKMYLENKKTFEEYIIYYHNLVKKLNEKMEKESGEIYLFGAHIFSQFLIAFGLNIERITCVLDNDVKKQGKRLYGTKLQVASPVILNDKKEPKVILKTAAYADEIKTDIISNINSGTKFWV